MKRQTADRTLEELTHHHVVHPRRVAVPVLVRDGRPCALGPVSTPPYNVNPFASPAVISQGCSASSYGSAAVAQPLHQPQRCGGAALPGFSEHVPQFQPPVIGLRGW